MLEVTVENRAGIDVGKEFLVAQMPRAGVMTALFIAVMMISMRTTVTLDSDVEQLLREKVRQSRQSFKQVLNNAIRQGLRDESGVVASKAFRVKARPMRLRVGIDPARLSEVADDLEVQAFLEVTKRLGKRKAR